MYLRVSRDIAGAIVVREKYGTETAPHSHFSWRYDVMREKKTLPTALRRRRRYRPAAHARSICQQGISSLKHWLAVYIKHLLGKTSECNKVEHFWQGRC
eukprot:gene8194-biopygen19617